MKTWKELERDIILQRLREFEDNRTRTASSLGIGIRTLQRKLIKWGIGPATKGTKVQIVETNEVFETKTKAGKALFGNVTEVHSISKVNDLIGQGKMVEI